MSRLGDFYRGEGTDVEGRTLDEILGWSDDGLEYVHDFIQWLFPLPEPSQFNPDAPLLTAADRAVFRADPRVRENLHRSFHRFLTFLGLEAADGVIREGPNFDRRQGEVWARLNHNWLRITRVLRCLHLTGHQDQARALYDWLAAQYQRRRFPIPADTFRYWTRAVGLDGA